MKCEPGCTCSRHKVSDELRAKRAAPRKKCEPGCTCSRHQRVMSDEHKANIAKANAARRGESHKCPEGCTCNRHQGRYWGGAKLGRVISEQGRKKLSEGALRRVRTPEELEKLAALMRANHADPEWEANRLEALVEACTGVVCPDGCTCEKHSERVRQALADARLGSTLSEETKAKIGKASREAWAKFTPEERSEIAWLRIKKYGVAKVSQAEYALAPHLAVLGFTHNDDRALCVGRKFPDFYDLEGKRLFEYFGNYWHPRAEEADEVIDYYKLLGWECEVLWEVDFYEWVRDHPLPVTEKPPVPQ